MEKIVTKDWLKRRLKKDVCFSCCGIGASPTTTFICRRCGGTGYVKSNTITVLGRALVAIYNNQTGEEKASFSTKILNGVGFTGPDAKLGTRAAKEFIATGTLPDWLAKAWLVEKAGYPRICKYARQLNEIANAKKSVGI